MSSHLETHIVRPEKIGKKDFAQRVKELRYRLVQVQNEVKRSKFPVIVLFGGVDGAGKHETVDILNEWMDPRFLKAKAYRERNAVEKEYPEMWRFWRDLPQAGEMFLYLSAWTSRPLMDRVKKGISKHEFQAWIDRIAAFEKTQVDNGALILKFWMHLDRDKQHKRLIKLSSDEEISWQIRASDWENLGLYQRFVETADEIIQGTSAVPWTIVDGSLEKERTLLVAETILNALEKRLEEEEEKKGKRVLSTKCIGKGMNHFKKVDLSASVEKAEYRKRLKELQSRLAVLQSDANNRGIATALVFEGWDAAGKGGAIRRITQALDARQYEVLPVGAPTQEELDHHYMWRFWKQLPSAGRMTIFDRSWYGRVLVERIEGFATKQEWHRAFGEILQCEQEWHQSGMVVCKFWLHISKEEQLRRFEDREKTPYKSWKLTDEDWRNREKWDAYLDAGEDMFELTSTKDLPWTIVPSNQKYFARLMVLETVCNALQKRLES